MTVMSILYIVLAFLAILFGVLLWLFYKDNNNNDNNQSIGNYESWML